MNKISLSYTTMQAALMEPHTYMNKMMGLKTFSTQAMDLGNAAHEIIQKHISGVEAHPILTEKKLPTFSLVERVKWDDQMRVKFEINDKYYFTGFIDGDEPARKEFLEIKTGKTWTAGDFARLIQWKLYAIGRPQHTKAWMLNAPKDPEMWMPETIRLYNIDISDSHRQEGWDYIKKVLGIIENIKEEIANAQKLKADKGYTGRSRWCYYEGCEWCEK